MDPLVMGWSAGRHVDHPCRGKKLRHGLLEKSLILPDLREYQGLARAVLDPISTSNHEGETHPQKPPTQIKAQFEQTISGQFVQTVPLFPFKIRNRQKEFVQTVLYLGGWFLGGSPSLDQTPNNQKISREGLFRSLFAKVRLRETLV